MGSDLRHEFERFLRFIRVDPEHAFFANLGDRLQAITPGRVRFLASGAFLYATLLLVESAGLMRRAFWAAWLAIGETAFFVPVEIFELLRGFSKTMLAILAINVTIVWYLLRNRRRLFPHGG
jgi:uncharacterized membrane protein (DUF2068 family)